MSKNDQYQPPFTITPQILRRTADIGEAVGRLAAEFDKTMPLALRRVNRIRTVQGSLAIEGNTLTEAQITAILNGKRVIAPPREIQEAKNALAAYDHFTEWNPRSEKDLLSAHRMMMNGLMEKPGTYRHDGVGVVSGGRVIHLAPPAKRVPLLMSRLFEWLKTTEHHPLIAGSVFHYEFEFIHPFSDGNGRMGRLWQTLILSGWNPVFSQIPVESLIHERQREYYDALQNSTNAGESSPFIEFMLKAIQETVVFLSTPQVAPQVTPQVKNLIRVALGAMQSDGQGEMTSRELQLALNLSDRKSFRDRHLLPALNAGYLEMTRPDKPNSRLQKYRITDAGRQILEL